MNPVELFANFISVIYPLVFGLNIFQVVPPSVVLYIFPPSLPTNPVFTSIKSIAQFCELKGEVTIQFNPPFEVLKKLLYLHTPNPVDSFKNSRQVGLYTFA